MSRLPAVRRVNSLSMTTRMQEKAARAHHSNELEIFRYALDSHRRAELDRLDAEATAAAFQGALDVEFNFMDYGLGRSGGSEVKVELVRRKLELLASINERRIRRDFRP
jgi:hypothetical protein